MRKYNHPLFFDLSINNRMFIFMLPVLLLLNLVGVFSLISPLYLVAKPNCTDVCGNIKIPFPLSIGNDCFFDEWYAIVCIINKIPRLNKTDLEPGGTEYLVAESLYFDDITFSF